MYIYKYKDVHIISVWTTYSDNRLCGNGETDLIMKTEINKVSRP